MKDDRLFLDSGAYTVWTQGAEIDIDVYADFCSRNPEVSYYVNLDAIPGELGKNRTRDSTSIREACEKGWNNYQRMIQSVPKEKVIPVFHRGESKKWLRKYLDSGANYIGIGQAVHFGGKSSQLAWLEKLSREICDGAGRPRVRTHGFAVTSFQLMRNFPWHSVDSTSWLKQASFGTVYVPKMENGNYVYDRNPLLVNVSPKSPSRDKKYSHYTNLTPVLKQQVDDYFDMMKVKMGKYEIVEIPNGYKKSKTELWWDKNKTQVLRILEYGLTTCHQRRFRLNAAFIKKVDVGVKRIYFAGGEGSVDERVEFRLGNRLMSYHKVGMKVSKGSKTFDKWRDLIR